MIGLAVRQNDVTLCLSCVAQVPALKFSGHPRQNGTIRGSGGGPVEYGKL